MDWIGYANEEAVDCEVAPAIVAAIDQIGRDHESQ